ncbi:hypothetical protein POX_g09269 [Penicillium oxalicum]|uniref:Uncharacterized protein n=1 Tax=Penicillium oxalicum (strain 114-2 / CGMCC 5302) TaxID=933388 RepID=S8AWZ9_PENO1|nr:hypothetical protein POX_g09269 [Penicillium oxalicum]EPS26432.1 hypothetical protein PDE_01369 [Penicillium oxalicum 114-2]KAI2786873.1 hypothetical protein POX_g09269 [Penicillium oxalicum]
MDIIRLLNPEIDDETMDVLERRSPEDRSLFALLVTSADRDYATEPKALEKFFAYIKAGRALVDSLTDSDVPVQQLCASKTLIRALHAGLERELAHLNEMDY